MATTKDSALAHPSTTEPQPGYALRGLGLFELHRDEILSSYRGDGRWLIPSGTEPSKVYEVRVGVRRPSTCECIGYEHHRHCSHVVCAERAHRLSGTCDCCGERRWWPSLRAVEEDDGLLSWFVGDTICGDCGREGAWA